MSSVLAHLLLYLGHRSVGKSDVIFFDFFPASWSKLTHSPLHCLFFFGTPKSFGCRSCSRKEIVEISHEIQLKSCTGQVQKADETDYP